MLLSQIRLGTIATLYALLRKEYLEKEAGGEVGVESSAPFVLVHTPDVPNIVQGDTIAITGTTYTIWAMELDGEGMTDLRLRV